MPLHYLVIMRQMMCVVLLLVSWVWSFLHSVIQLSTIYGHSFCGPNVIDHYICEMYPLLKLVCTDTYVTGFLVVANEWLISSISLLLLLISYAVFLGFLKNLSQQGRQKDLQTCGSCLHHHGWLLLCSLYFHVCKTSYDLSHWQIIECVLYNCNPYVESINLQYKEL